MFVYSPMKLLRSYAIENVGIGYFPIRSSFSCLCFCPQRKAM